MQDIQVINKQNNLLKVNYMFVMSCLLAYSLQTLPKCNEKYIQDYIEAIQKLEENSKEEQDIVPYRCCSGLWPY